MAQVSPSALPTVRLEVRNGSARPALHEVSDIGFLIGSVPGCDLRLPGADLPPVICLISRRPGGASIRKLVPTQPLLVNGRSVATSVLNHGDCVTLGTVELVVQVQSESASEKTEGGVVFAPINPSLQPQEQLARFQAEQKARRQESEELARQLDLRWQQLEEQTQELETDRVIWYRRREEIEQECRQQQKALAAREEELNLRERALSAGTSKQAEETSLSQAKAAQLLEMQQRLAADREALRAREAALLQEEQAREALQEQLRRRSEELAARQRSLSEQARKQAEEIAALKKREAEVERQRQSDEERSATLRQELAARAAGLEQLRGELAQREEQLHRHAERLKRAGRNIGASRKALSKERGQWKAEQQAGAEAIARNRAELEAARREAVELHERLPELELRAQAAVERLIQAREQLREHLRELHAYARQSQEDIEALRAQVEAEAQQVQQQRLALYRARDEHGLAVAAFRQQLIEWQGQVAEMKRSLAQGENRLEHQPEEVQQHLGDMREWYRRKLRDLSERRQAENEARKSSQDETETVDPGSDTRARAILTLDEEVEPGDRALGEQLRSLDLVDADTLASLLFEARAQRRSLRQTLLAGGYLTLYQLALIEAGNVDGLVLGPLRVIDRLRVTAREAVYRVFDPRRGHEAVLRHLAEAEIPDALDPAEFRQGFRQAAPVQDPHVVATYEVLEIGGRPAVLQEVPTGLPSTDWPGVAALPAVWYRLVCQAALGLRAAHQAGLIHGHLQPGLFLLTGEGIVKLSGVGERLWLAVPPVAKQNDVTPATDLADFGRIAAGWLALSRRQASKVKRLGMALQAILDRLTAEAADTRYATAAALLEDLDKAAATVPANSKAWDQLLHDVREHVPEDRVLRQSA